MKGQEKIQYVTQQSDAVLDTFFQLRLITDVAHQGSDDLYLQGLTGEALFTSYHDVLSVMEWLHHQGARSWCDLGCGVGRTVLLWSWLFDDAQGVGVELVPERLQEARGAALSLGLGNTRWIEGDFSSPSVKLPKSDVYFLYLSTGPALDAVLEKIKKSAPQSWVVVIESHGDLKPRLQWESWWLAPQAQRFPLKSQRHDPWLAVYRVRSEHAAHALERSWEGKSGLLPHELSLHPSPLGYLLSKSFQRHWEVVIGEDGAQWTMETIGLRWHAFDTIQGQFPPRQFKWKPESIGVRHLPNDPTYSQWATWRRENTQLRYQLKNGETASGVVIRKIFVSPSPCIEFSNGRQVPVEELALLESKLGH